MLNHYGVQIRKVNHNSLRGKCPLPTHSSDKSIQSFGVHLEKNIWSCQSTSCASARSGRKGGNIIDFVSIMENCSIRDAALKLKDWFLLKSRAGEGTRTKIETKEKIVAENKSENSDEEINKPLPFVLKDVDPTHPYLKDRGVEEETTRNFGVGLFSGRGLMASRVVIPIHNERGEIIAYAGRAIDETEPKYKLPAGFKKSEVLFNLHRVLALQEKGSDCVIVVEGFFDCIKVHQAGFPVVVALMGSSLSEAQEKLLLQFPRVLLFLDGDEAGQLATEAIASKLISKTFVKVIRLADSKQPDQLSADELKRILR